MTNPRSLAATALAVFSVLLLAFFCTLPMHDYDLGYHLAIGKYLVEMRAFPDADPFSFTHPTGIWPLHQGVPALFIYAAYAACGPGGLFVLQGIIVALTCMLMVCSVAPTKRPTIDAVLMVTASLILARERILLRADLFSMLCFAVLIWLLRDLQMRPRRKILWALTALVGVWCHVHAGVIYGAVLVCAWSLGSFSDRNTRPLIWPVAQAVGAGLLLGFFSVGLYNPGGMYGLLEPFVNVNDAYFRKTVLEFLPPPFSSHRLFFLLCGVNAALLLSAGRKIHRGWGAAWLVFAVLGLRIERILVYACILQPILWSELSQVASVAVQRRCMRFAACTYALLLGIFLCNLPWSVSPDFRWHKWGRWLDTDALPVGAMDYLKPLKPQGRVFNEDAWGGWIAFFFYPQLQTFIDNRLPVFGAPFFEKTYFPILKGQRGWRLALASDRVDWVWVRTDLSGEGIQARLLKDPDWNLEMIDDSSMLFRKLHSGEKRRAALELVLAPLQNPPAALNDDLESLAGRQPSPMVLNLLGIVTMEQHGTSQALEYFARAYALDTCNPQTVSNFGRALDLSGQRDAATSLYRRALRCPDPEWTVYRRWVNRLEHEGQWLKAQRTLQLAMRRVGPLPEIQQRLQKIRVKMNQKKPLVRS